MNLFDVCKFAIFGLFLLVVFLFLISFCLFFYSFHNFPFVFLIFVCFVLFLLLLSSSKNLNQNREIFRPLFTMCHHLQNWQNKIPTTTLVANPLRCEKSKSANRIFCLFIHFLFHFCYLFFSFSLLTFVPFFSRPQLDNYEIKPGKCLKINVSVPNLRLFVGNIPKSKGKEEILDEFGKLTGKNTSKIPNWLQQNLL